MKDWNHYDVNEDENYANEDEEIIILVKEDAVWESYITDNMRAVWRLLAYVDAEGQLHKDIFPIPRVSWYGTGDDNLKKTFAKGGIYRIKARRWIGGGPLSEIYAKNLVEFYLTELIEKLEHFPALEKVLEDYQKPVIVEDETLGELKLDKEISFFCGSVDFDSAKVSVSVEVNAQKETTWKKNIERLSEVYRSLKEYDENARELISTKLYKLACQYNEDEDIEISKELMKETVKISEIVLEGRNTLSLYYEDNDIFGGHAIVVEGSTKSGLKKAYIAG